MPLASLLYRPYQMLFVDSAESGPSSATLSHSSVDDEDATMRRQRQSSLNQFEKLSQKAREERHKDDHCSKIEGDDRDAGPTVRRRRNSVSSSSEAPPQVGSRFVQNPGFCAESAPPDAVGGLMSWFQSDWEQRNVGKSPIGLHTHVDSPFSSSSGFGNFRGLLNLGIILLAVSNVRLVLENLLRHGLLARPLLLLEQLLTPADHCTWLGLLLAACCLLAAAFGVELLAEAGRLGEWTARSIAAGVTALLLALPCCVILHRSPSPLVGFPTLFCCTCVCLKMWSYHDVNAWCRDERRRRRLAAGSRSVASGLADLGAGDADDNCAAACGVVRYPANLTPRDLCYFLLVPTLCYELNYPRLLRVRRRFLAKRIAEMLLLPQLMAVLGQQWISPILDESLRRAPHSWPAALELLLRLAVPNHLLWLLLFYAFFHSALNVVGELLLFGDRSFYSGWWNSESVAEFWTLWNVPAHRFAKRHLYKPLVERWRLSRTTATVVVFGVSGVLHELLVSVPLRLCRLWAFAAMLLQVPLAMLVRRLAPGGGQLGNVVVWASIILGQPLAILMYFYAYYVTHWPTE